MTQTTTTPTKQPRNEGKNYRYLQLQTNEGTGFACVYLEWKKDNDKISFGAGLSFCSPKDDFVKDRARAMAFQRFTNTTSRSRRVTGSVNVTATDKTYTSAEESEAILLAILKEANTKMVTLHSDNGSEQKHSIVPNWAQRAINTNKFKVGLRQEQGDLREVNGIKVQPMRTT